MYTLEIPSHMHVLFIYIQTSSVILSTSYVSFSSSSSSPLDKTITAPIDFYGCCHWCLSL